MTREGGATVDSGSDPAGGSRSRPPSTVRFRFPVRTPLRWFLMACFCGLCAFVEILAWAAFGLPVFFLHGGVILLILGVLLTVRALVFRKRADWTLQLTPTHFTVVQGGTQRMAFAWTTVRRVDVRGFGLSVLGPSSAPLAQLVLDTKAADPKLLAEMLATVNERIAEGSAGFESQR
jgi:hypothetical protein